MLFDNLREQVQATSKRYVDRTAIRNDHLKLIAEKKYLSVDSPDRINKFLHRNGINPAASESFMINREKNLPEVDEVVGGVQEPNALERIMGFNDLMAVSFLERGLQVAKAVCKIWVNIENSQPEGFGTGFLISNNLLLTNHHVLESAAIAAKSQAEFNYQVGLDNVVGPSATFTLDTGTFFITDKDMDFTIVAVNSSSGNGKDLKQYGYTTLIEDEGKFILPQYLNIIQHPNGDTKQLCLRENQAIDIEDLFVQYKTDTAPGSSGSPVFNDKWEVVALHHSGVWKTNAQGKILTIDNKIWEASMGENRIQWISNEGVRISRIIRFVKAAGLNAAQQAMFLECFEPPVYPVNVKEMQVSPHVIQAPAKTNISQLSVSQGGVATWTIPLTVSINLGGAGLSIPSNSVGVATAPADTSPAQAPASTAPGSPDEILQAAKKEFLKMPDVVAVRLGWVFENGWATNEQALMITVKEKLSVHEMIARGNSSLPKEYLGMPIEVINPTITELFQLAVVSTGAVESTRSFFPTANEIKYFSPDNEPLDTVEEKMNLTAFTSPDQGWPMLEDFISKTKTSLVIGMYDFGAVHIVKAIEKLKTKASFKKLILVIQAGQSVGSGTKKNDIKDAEVIKRFKDAFGNKFETVYVKMGSKNGWVNTSYHIKVIVRDHNSMWLSSGNLQSSNEPLADPLNEHPQVRHWLTEYNREWHVITNNIKLSKLYEAYILHDLAENEKLQGEEIFALPEFLIPDLLLPPAEEAVKPFKYFQPFSENRIFKVTPILTPDNYLKEVIPLIESAQSEILIQNQTFNAPGDDPNALSQFMKAVIDRQKDGVQVRVIFRAFMPADDMVNVSGLVNFGFKRDKIKLQKNCHTKGIIIDSKRVLIGSQNISNLGISDNRDASLLVDDEKLALHFKEIFEHDWKNLAESKITSSAVSARTVDPDEKTPANMVRISWKDYMEML